jgi:hypothetical protein
MCMRFPKVGRKSCLRPSRRSARPVTPCVRRRQCASVPLPPDVHLYRGKAGQSCGCYPPNLQTPRRENLRVTFDQNPQNIGKRKDNSSGYKGVSFHKASGKWQARIRLKGQSTCLGFFPSAESAALVYDAAALEYHKEFATTNLSLGLLAVKKPVVSVVTNSSLILVA